MTIGNAYGGGVFEFVLQTTWQAAVLAGLIILVQWIFRKKLSPGWRYGLWLLLIARLAIPFSPPSDFSIFNLANYLTVPDLVSESKSPVSTSEQAFESRSSSTFEADEFSSRDRSFEGQATEAPLISPETRAEHSALTNGPSSLTKLPFVIWLVGVSVLGLRLIWTNARFRSRIRQHVPISDGTIRHLLDDVHASLGVRQVVTLIETEEVETPAIYGLWHKALLLPDGSVERFTSSELRHIFLHELAHLKRRDLDTNWLVAALHILHWFNPILWMAFAKLRADRELATDELALLHAKENERIPYGETMLKVVEAIGSGRRVPGLVCIAETKTQLRRRLAAIGRHGTSNYSRCLALALIVVLGASALTDARVSEQTDSPSSGAEGDAAIPSFQSHEEEVTAFTLHIEGTTSYTNYATDGAVRRSFGGRFSLATDFSTWKVKYIDEQNNTDVETTFDGNYTYTLYSGRRPLVKFQAEKLHPNRPLPDHLTFTNGQYYSDRHIGGVGTLREPVALPADARVAWMNLLACGWVSNAPTLLIPPWLRVASPGVSSYESRVHSESDADRDCCADIEFLKDGFVEARFRVLSRTNVRSKCVPLDAELVRFWYPNTPGTGNLLRSVIRTTVRSHYFSPNTISRPTLTKKTYVSDTRFKTQDAPNFTVHYALTNQTWVDEGDPRLTGWVQESKTNYLRMQELMKRKRTR